MAQHAASAGALSADEPEVVVADGQTVLPDALTATRRGGAKADGAAAAEGAAAEQEGAAKPGRPMDPKKFSQPFWKTITGGVAAAASPAAASPATADGANCAELGDAVPWAPPADSAVHSLLHCHGGGGGGCAVTEGELVAATRAGYTPLFAPAPSLLEELGDFFGISKPEGGLSHFPLSRLVARSPKANRRVSKERGGGVVTHKVFPPRICRMPGFLYMTRFCSLPHTPPYPTLPPRPPSNSTTSLTPSNLTTSLPPSNLTTSLPPSPNSTPSLIMLSSGVSELLERDSAGGTLRVVNTGVRVFERNLAKGLR